MSTLIDKMKALFWFFIRKPAPAPAPAPARVIPAEPKRGISLERKESLRIARLRREIADKTNDVLDRFIAPKFNLLDDKRGAYDAEEALQDLVGDFYFPHFVDQLPGGSQWGALDPSGESKEFAEAMWPINVGLVLRYDEGDGERDSGMWIFRRVRTIEARLLRGRIRLTPNKIVLSSAAKFYDDGFWYAESVPLGLLGDRWVPLDSNMQRERFTGALDGSTVASIRKTSNKLREEADRTVAMSCSLALTERYNWHASLGTSHSRLLLPTNPSGCLKLFKDRKKGDAERRRAALRHWVGHHLRETEAVGVSYVRDHLRGATHFDWYDLSCDLMVSDFDLEKNEAFRTEAEIWRKNRGHNAVRVRFKR